ncbi:MAG: hypothetical protein CMC18_02110 [Flavobacteriaceae bacterium]|nr:hypothetical protein [Flavobacteriaceae bacterium]
MTESIYYQEVLELLKMILEDDPFLIESFKKNDEKDKLISRDELLLAIEEVSSDKIQKELEEKLENYRHTKKSYLMKKYGIHLFTGRIVRSTIDAYSKGSKYKKVYSSYKKYY